MYTKGPWLIHEEDQSCIVDASGRTSDARNIAYVDEEKENWDDEWDGDWRDNARLIAAAPELLEALREARFVLLGHGFSAGEENGIIGTIDALLALARRLRRALQDECDDEDDFLRTDGCDCNKCAVIRDSSWLEE